MNAALTKRLRELEGELKRDRNKGGGYDLDGISLKENDGAELWEYKLKEHLRRYWKGYEVVKIELQPNLLGQFIFRRVHLKGQTHANISYVRVVHFCKRARIQNWKDSWWYVNERKVGKRSGKI